MGNLVLDLHFGKPVVGGILPPEWGCQMSGNTAGCCNIIEEYQQRRKGGGYGKSNTRRTGGGRKASGERVVLG